jgi:hypothetical protein
MADTHHLRLTLRQPDTAEQGAKYVVMNDKLEIIDSESGEVIGDLSRYLRKIEVVDEVGNPRIWKLEMFAGDQAAETELPRPGTSSP